MTTSRRTSALVLGQAVTSRTETLEEYLKERCDRLAVIALGGLRQRYGGRSVQYDRGKPVKSFRIPSLYVKGSSSYHTPLVMLHFAFSFLSIILSVKRLRTRFQVAIGVSTFYAFVGILLKKSGFVDNVVYYTIDYYPSRSFLNTLFRKLDEYCVKNSEVVWSISPNISGARRMFLGDRIGATTDIVVPLTYSSRLLSQKPLDEIERWSIGFVGTLEYIQGLQLLIEAMPEIIEHLPQVVVRVVGDGPYAGELKRLVRSSGLQEHFKFYGFVKDESKMIDILSKCAIGMSPYVPTPGDYTIATDMGKSKLYTFLGLPVITTKTRSGLLIDSKHAGIAVDYDARELARAVVSLLSDVSNLAKYREDAHVFAKSYCSEEILGDVFKRTLAALRSGHNETASVNA